MSYAPYTPGEVKTLVTFYNSFRDGIYRRLCAVKVRVAELPDCDEICANCPFFEQDMEGHELSLVELEAQMKYLTAELEARS